MLQNVQNRPCPGHQKPGKLNLSKIKYVKFSPRIKISYRKMSEEHVKNTQFCVLWPNRCHFLELAAKNYVSTIVFEAMNRIFRLQTRTKTQLSYLNFQIH